MRFFITIIFLLFANLAWSQRERHTYEESFDDILNPERGFYIPTGTKASGFQPLQVQQLKRYRDSCQKLTGATYCVPVSLIYRGYELDSYKQTSLSESFLANLQRDFDAIREAGLKVILRFAYTNTAKGGDCKDEYKICPPYGDATRHIVLQHIQQLQPVLRRNADIIAVLQEGFIGIWGENYFTDYFGDASTNGLGVITDSSWRHRNEVLSALLSALPSNRMVQVRTPQIKQKAVYGPRATVNSKPLTKEQAFSGIPIARIGFHNDCLLSTADDYGTYYDYGSSAQPRQPANNVLRRYIEQDTKFTAVGGETCDDAFSPQNDCAPLGYAEEELRRMHYSYLNAGYNTAVNNDWDSAGCLASIRRNLGYRFVLRNATFASAASCGTKMKVLLTLENTGYAAPFNPRPMLLVLRNKQSNAAYVFPIKQNIHSLVTGIHRLEKEMTIPFTLPKGSYEMFLSMPDENAALAKRPEYSIRLANKQTWEEKTGYNNLHHTIQIK